MAWRMVAASFRAGTMAVTPGQAVGGTCFARSSSNSLRRQNMPRNRARYSQMANEIEAAIRRIEGTEHSGAACCAATTEDCLRFRQGQSVIEFGADCTGAGLTEHTAIHEPKFCFAQCKFDILGAGTGLYPDSRERYRRPS